MLRSRNVTSQIVEYREMVSEYETLKRELAQASKIKARSTLKRVKVDGTDKLILKAKRILTKANTELPDSSKLLENMCDLLAS